MQLNRDDNRAIAYEKSLEKMARRPMRRKRKLCGLGIPAALQVLGLAPAGLLVSQAIALPSP